MAVTLLALQRGPPVHRYSERFSQNLVPKNKPMARWPERLWTTLFTYSVIFVGFPLLCYIFWYWVRGKP